MEENKKVNNIKIWIAISLISILLIILFMLQSKNYTSQKNVNDAVDSKVSEKTEVKVSDEKKDIVEEGDGKMDDNKNNTVVEKESEKEEVEEKK